MTQTVIVIALVLLAALYLGRMAWRALRPAKDAGCGSGCGCGPASAPRRRDETSTR